MLKRVISSLSRRHLISAWFSHGTLFCFNLSSVFHPGACSSHCRQLEAKVSEARLSAAAELLRERQQADEKLRDAFKDLTKTKEQEQVRC